MPTKITGHWQSIVWWLEWGEDGRLELQEGVFESEEERFAYLSSRIDTGNVYDLVGVIESSWTEAEGEMTTTVPAADEEEGLWAGPRRDRDVPNEWTEEKEDEEN